MTDLEEAIAKLETKHRIETYLMKIGASEEAAKLLAASEHAAKFRWDGVNLCFEKSDLAAVDDEKAKQFFHEGPFRVLFVKPQTAIDTVAALNEKIAAIDPALLLRARQGNKTAQAVILRDSLGGDLSALNVALAADKTTTDDGAGTHKKPDGHDTRDNPFLKLRDPRTGAINAEAAKRIDSMLKSMPTKVVADIAKAAGMNLSGLPLNRS
jgi:hypothetical protein